MLTPSNLDWTFATVVTASTKLVDIMGRTNHPATTATYSMLLLCSLSSNWRSTLLTGSHHPPETSIKKQLGPPEKSTKILLNIPFQLKLKGNLQPESTSILYNCTLLTHT